MSDNPMAQLSALMQKAGEILKQHGLELHQFAAVPHPDPDGNHMVQIVATITEDAFKTDEQKEIDAQFKEIAIREKHEERERAAREAAKASREALMEMMNDGGIGLDDTPTVGPLSSDDDE